ncbi:hypothetical protein GYMLUDRAFT_75668 [Collybiopsis luxurians FD-317 M1]|uniref:Telomere-associated protein Rif1 N-terminal domain-containing protein n=1 Tax=Collybiopsis luxurians FD-317 M1 TaxID=944289 RepID=A0A0D0CPC3_9AGAR|nr:hypothetical protein GYMLUDRAFT_75668 [Collybiopsis luxurians FD-317 M1]
MSLPTPPTTSHREKENRSLETGSRNVVWSKQNQIHSLSTPPKGPSCSSASQVQPGKSILKPTQPLLPLPEEKPREETPAPSSPLKDAQYLQHPISTIISQDATLSDLIRAYSVLTARIRPYVNEETNSSSPLFEPLLANREKVTESICRDVRRALENPLGEVEEEEEKQKKEHKLPSPTKSPKKKKRGMTAEQAKYARDLCTISHSVLKFLGIFLAFPIYRVFTNQQLVQMLGSITAIPMAPELPTPNARKTYALSICVIQGLRLPEGVLAPAKDTIAHVLGRGIDGELGKEGKKGSATDGLKAIHDLSLHKPALFVPAFGNLMDSILYNLLSPSLNLRVQAAHALGGLAQASVALPLSPVHTDLSSWIVDFLLSTPTRVSPTKKDANGNAAPTTQESDICRTLRTTLNAENPVHVTHGPVWALHVMGSFIVLLGSAFKTDARVCRTISSLLILTLRHKKAAVRKLACIVWRMVVWSWHQYLLPSLDDSEQSKSKKPERPVASQNQWGLIEMVLTCGVGISTCYAIVGSELGPAELLRLDRILTLMVNRNEESRDDVMRCIIQLVNLERQEVVWELDKLLSPSFMSGMADVLAVDFQDVSKSITAIREELPDIRDFRGLTREELLELGTMSMLLEVWSTAISIKNGQHNNEDLLMETWDAMLKTVMTLAEDDGEEAESKATQKLVAALSDSLRTSPKETKSSDRADSSSKQEYHWDLAKNIRMVHRAWASLYQLLQSRLLEDHATQLLGRVVEFEDELGEMEDEVRGEWAALCANLILASGEPMQSLSLFWGQVDSKWNWPADIRTLVWTKFVQLWQESKQDNWEGSIVLISTPFCSQNAWDLNDDELSIWEKFLTYIVNRGLDYGYDAVAVVDTIARKLQQKCNPTFTSLARIADMLMSIVENSFKEITALPENLVDFVSDTLNQSYPPSPSMGFSTAWMIRSLGRLIEACPTELCLNLLESLQDSVVLWIADENSAATESYDDVVYCYENLLMKLEDPCLFTQECMERFAPILNAMFNGPLKPLAAYDAFDTFWHERHTVFEAVDPRTWPTKVCEYIYGSPEASSSAPALPQQVEARVEGEEAEEHIGSIANPEITSDETVVASPEPGLALVPAPRLSSSSIDSEMSPRSVDLHSSPALQFPDSPAPNHPDQGGNPSSLPLPIPVVLSTPPRVSKGQSRESPSGIVLFATPSPPSTPGGSGGGKFKSLFSPEKTPSRSSKPLLAPSPLIKSLPPSSPLASVNKRRRISGNKENEIPSSATCSPSRRDLLAIGSPSLRPSALRKRPFGALTESGGDELAGRGRVLEFGEKEKERPAKRVRISEPIPAFVLPMPTQVPMDSDAAFHSDTSSSLKSSSPPLSSKSATDSFVNASQRLDSVLRKSLSLPKKRKALQLDYVEIKVPSSKGSQALKALTNDREMKTPTRRLSKSGGKRKTLTMVSPVQGPDAEGDLDPDLHEILDIPSSDSDLGSDDTRSVQQLSSDDDPHLGQVTPGHLISPALKRVSRADEDEDLDPPSDDSDYGFGSGAAERSAQDSPSRQVMMRRLQRTASANGSGTSAIGVDASQRMHLGHLLSA